MDRYRRVRQRVEGKDEASRQPVHEAESGKASTGQGLAYSQVDIVGMVRDPRLDRPANTEPRAALLRSGQHTLGNVALRQVAQPEPTTARSCGFSPHHCPFGGVCHACPVQAKLTVNPPGDIYEQEADRVAEAVLRMPAVPLPRQAQPEEEESVHAQRLPAPVMLRVQRQASPEEEEEQAQASPLQRQASPEEEEEQAQASPLQRQASPEEEEEQAQASLLQCQALPEEEEQVQRKPLTGAIQAAAGGRVPQVTAEMEERIGRLRNGGRPLGEAERAFFEPRLGHDFGAVRIHTGAEAAGTALALQAKAFTVGQDIVFGAGQYAPETTAGRSLLAHELAHVIQQSSETAGPASAGGNLPESEGIYRQVIQREPAGCPPGRTNLSVGNATRNVSANNLAELAGILGEEAGSVGFVGDIDARFCPDDPARPEQPVETAQVTARLVKTMPRWTNAGRQCQEVQSHWQERLACLDVHENGHIERHRRWYGNVHEQLVGMTVNDAMAELERIRGEDDDEQRRYDEATAHGISQGSCTTRIDTRIVCPSERSTGTGGEEVGESGAESGPASESETEEVGG